MPTRPEPIAARGCALNTLTTQTFSISEARRLALAAQGFGSAHRTKHGNPGRQASVQTLRKVMDRLHLLQLDSVPIITRTQYLPAFSRHGHYPAHWHDRLAYQEHEWFETWAHEASLLPVRLEPLMRWQKTRARNGEVWPSLRRVAAREATYIDEVLREVRQRGPLRASELSDPRPVAGGAGWGRGSMGALALDWLYRAGELGIRRTGNFEKSFDVIDRIVAPEILRQPTPSEPDAISALLLLAARACGVGTAEDLADYFRLPIKPARQCLQQMLEAGQLQRCAVEGWPKPAYCLPGVRLPAPVQACAVLSPFDPVVWHRDRNERLFDFEYRLEIYTPQAKRRWGYYVLPFLLGDRVVARVDLKNDRAFKVLRVPAVHLEAGQHAGHVAEALATELALLATFLDCERIVVGRRGNLHGALRQAVRGLVAQH